MRVLVSLLAFAIHYVRCSDIIASDLVDRGQCPTDYHASPTDPDWKMSPVGAAWGPKCYRDATSEWSNRGWAACPEVCFNGVYCGRHSNRRSLGYCAGSQLVTVSSLEEEEWIAQEFLFNENRSGQPGPIWIGFGYYVPGTESNPDVSGPAGRKWSWLSGSYRTYTNWASGAAPTEGCAALKDLPNGALGGWHAESCSTSYRCICEVTPHLPPAPPQPPVPLAPPTPPPPESGAILIAAIAGSVGGVVALVIVALLTRRHCRGGGPQRPLGAETKTTASQPAVMPAVPVSHPGGEVGLAHSMGP